MRVDNVLRAREGRCTCSQREIFMGAGKGLSVYDGGVRVHKACYIFPEEMQYMDAGKCLKTSSHHHTSHLLRAFISGTYISMAKFARAFVIDSIHTRKARFLRAPGTVLVRLKSEMRSHRTRLVYGRKAYACA